MLHQCKRNKEVLFPSKAGSSWNTLYIST